jgi:mannose-1-phosphate guanylyltransferase
MPKKRVSLTLDQELVAKVDKEADNYDINRSQMMEKITEDYFHSKGIDTAVIFCGGAENETLTLHEGKPVLSHILEHLSQEGVKRAILLVGNNKDDIEPHFGSKHDGITLEYVEESDPEGTASALLKAEDMIGDTFVAMNGNVISDVDFKEMLDVHREGNAVATLGLTTVEDASQYGVITLKGQKVMGFEEKPSKPATKLINAGTYILEPEIFSVVEDKAETDLVEVFKHLTKDNRINGYIYGGEWVDIS